MDFHHFSGVPITRMLHAWHQGDQRALKALTPLIYGGLQKLAKRQMTRERNGHTLQATALVHEAYIRIANSALPAQDRHHFFSTMAKLMRQILVDHARSKGRHKRCPLPPEEALLTQQEPVQRLSPADIDEALSALALNSPRLAHVTELHYFAGLSCSEIATIAQLSESSIQRDLRLAKAWMLQQLTNHDS